MFEFQAPYAMIRSILFILLSLSAGQTMAQLGGTSTYKALALPGAPRITSVGGNALAIMDNDINTALDNPAFIQSSIHRQLSFSNNFYFAGINYGTLAYAYSFERAGNFLYSMKYVSYGEMQGTDDGGNLGSTFRAGDYVITTGYGSTFKDRWLYGANVKLIYSHLESYQSFGVALDLSGAYHQEEKNLTVTAILKNVGLQLVRYTEGDREPLPLEVSLGLSKKFENIPLRISVVVHNLQKPNLAYEDPDAVTIVNIFGEPQGNDVGVVDKIFRHFIFGAEVDIAKPLSIRLGYNHQVRQEIALPSKKGLAGISVGAGIHIKQFSIDYAFAKYHAAANINHLGLTVNLQEFPGPKKEKGE